MKLKLKLGFHEPTRIINWWGGHVTNFPRLVTYKNNKYEFVMYDEDTTGESEYVCMFSEIPKYDPNYSATTFKDIAEWVDDQGWGGKCVCGAAYTSFAQIHMFYCPKWSKI